MNRWMSILGAACLMVASTGCLRHNLRNSCGNGCQTTASCGTCQTGACQTSACQTGTCNTGDCGSCEDSGGRGILNRLRNATCGSGACGSGGCRTGCVPGPIGWQQGGLNYSSHLQPGLLGCNAGAQMSSQPFTAGPPTAQVGYPYYTTRGPRDFFLDNPPTIGR
ncbi:MAG: hypothetical protein AAF958_18305 [Planctomycetota bacterium]